MLTPFLEKLIWDGFAEFKTWTIGTPSANLPVGNNETVVITDIDYFPFIDSGLADFTGAANWAKANKQLTISSLNKRYNYLTRAYFWESLGLLPDKQHFDTYLTFTDTINVGIVTIPSVTTWTVDLAQNPAGTQAKAPPLGYGQANDGGLITVNRIRMAAPVEIKPHKPTRPFPGFDQSYDDFQVSTNVATQVIPPNQDPSEVGNYQYPLITIGYVKVNENYKQNLL